MRVLITGGFGFIGKELSVRLLEQGHEVTLVGHARDSGSCGRDGLQCLPADTTLPGAWQERVGLQDVVVNLVGAAISRRWSREVKRLIYDSRVLSTRNLVQALPKNRPITLLSASAVGYYGFRGDEELSEDTAPGTDFLANLCRDWEGAALEAVPKGVRVVVTRFGIVLGRSGGMLQQLTSSFEKHLGGVWGSGKQWFSWIHEEDLLSAILFFMDRSDISGPVNCCSPGPVRNREFASALGRIMHRPLQMGTGAFVLKLALGEASSVLLEGQRAFPRVLTEKGFRFQFVEIDAALRDLLRA